MGSCIGSVQLTRPIKMKYLIVLAVLLFAENVRAEAKIPEREGKFLSMFNIVRFPNDACDAGGSRNGTCYTKEECSNKGGTEDGSCANGYGVCCSFVSACGAVIAENNTYFESEGEEKSHCSISVCKASDSIVQLRLDFLTFVITGPETSAATTAEQARTVGNDLNIDAAGTNSVTLASRCLTDVFSVSNPGGPSPPAICGTNTDEHMYVDMGADCVDLTFQLSSTSAQWKIRITQYESGYTNLAPFGCTQYYWKQDSDSDGKGKIQSYNWAGSYHLADQNQKICIRREDDKTKICYSVNAATDFAVSGKGNQIAANIQAYCGGYGPAGEGSYADALIVQSLETANGAAFDVYSNICGQSGFSTIAATPQTLCSSAVPFVVSFVSDSWEVAGNDAEGTTANDATDNQGFKIYYEQS